MKKKTLLLSLALVLVLSACGQAEEKKAGADETAGTVQEDVNGAEGEASQDTTDADGEASQDSADT